MFENEIVELQLAGAIKDTEEMAVAPFDKERVRSYLEDYSDVFEALKASIGYLPVPLDIMHTPNVCNYWTLYKHFEEIISLYDVAKKCEKGLEELKEILQKTEKRYELKEWLSKFEHVSAEAYLLPQRNNDSCFITFNKIGIEIKVLYDDFKAIFELTDAYFPLVEELKIPGEFISNIHWEN